MATYIKLARGNEWMVEFYHHAGKRDAKVVFTKGDVVAVRWPDGTETAEIVELKKCRTTCYDMGHEYPVEYELAGFWACDRGLRYWVTFDQVEVAL
jgi:hypothetical protein